jgi:hypothetical protein
MLDRTDLEQWFPNAEFEAVPVAALPPTLTDPASRTLLSEIGLPSNLLDVVEIDPNLSDRIRTIEDEYQEEDAHAPPGAADLLWLGFAGGPMLGLDGASGAVMQIDDERFGVRLLASSLESFLRVLGDMSRRVTTYQAARDLDTERFATELRAAVTDQLADVDPAALPQTEPAWHEIADDVAASAEWD